MGTLEHDICLMIRSSGSVKRRCRRDKDGGKNAGMEVIAVPGEKSRGAREEAGGMELNQEAESIESNCQGCGGRSKDTIWVSDIHDWSGDTGLEVKAVLGATEVMGIDKIAREQ